MSTENTIVGKIGGITVTIQPRDIDCYLITKPELDTIGSSTLLCEIFLFFASLSGGGLLTALLATLINVKNIPIDSLHELDFIISVFFAVFVVFFILYVSVFVYRLLKKRQFLRVGKVQI